MLYAILSDIHGNLEALTAVMDDLESCNIDKLVVLGDTIGYGPQPQECMEIVAEKADILLMGNHEKEAVVPDQYGFSGDARNALDWTLDCLKDFTLWQKWQSKIKQNYESTARKVEDNILWVHASPEFPVEQYVWPGHEGFYIMYNDQLDNHLLKMLEFFPQTHGFCGHTHVPALLTLYRHKNIFEKNQDWNREVTFIGPQTIFFVPQGETTIGGIKETKSLINPGSVGQPRDGSPLASYILYDGDRVTFCRVEYDVKVTQKKLAETGLEDQTKKFLVQRLAKGM